METGLITKERKFIPLPYYEIGNFAESICRQYIEENDENKTEFELFSEGYHHFYPYLDFLLFKLGYKMVNPLLRENSLWFVDNNSLYLQTNSSYYKYLLVTDMALQIKPISPEKLKECVIDFNGISYEIDRENGLHHEDIYELILNQYLIYNKDLFNLYEKYISNGLDIGCFCRNMLGFYHVAIYGDNSGFIIYCDDFKNPNMESICEEIVNINPKIKKEHDSVHTKESLAVANRCIEIVGEMNENRRFRL